MKTEYFILFVEWMSVILIGEIKVLNDTKVHKINNIQLDIHCLRQVKCHHLFYSKFKWSVCETNTSVTFSLLINSFKNSLNNSFNKTILTNHALVTLVSTQQDISLIYLWNCGDVTVTLFTHLFICKHHKAFTVHLFVCFCFSRPVCSIYSGCIYLISAAPLAFISSRGGCTSH